MTFNLSTGVLSGTPTTPGTFTFNVRFGMRSMPGRARLHIGHQQRACPRLPSILSIPHCLRAGSGTPYSQAFTGTGGTAPYVFRITVGALPGGLTLSTGGNLTGTPTIVGAYTFNVRMTDANGCVDEAGYDLVINNPACPMIIVNPTNPVLPPGVTGASYRQTFTATGGSAPYSFTISAGTLPPGSSLLSEGELTNAGFTAAGNYNFRLRATDANGCVGERQYTLVVNNPACPSITVNPSVLSNGTVGSAYSQTVTAAGGSAPHTFSVSAAPSLQDLV